MKSKFLSQCIYLLSLYLWKNPKLHKQFCFTPSGGSTSKWRPGGGRQSRQRSASARQRQGASLIRQPSFGLISAAPPPTSSESSEVGAPNGTVDNCPLCQPRYSKSPERLRIRPPPQHHTMVRFHKNLSKNIFSSSSSSFPQIFLHLSVPLKFWTQSQCSIEFQT